MFLPYLCLDSSLSLSPVCLLRQGTVHYEDTMDVYVGVCVPIYDVYIGRFYHLIPFTKPLKSRLWL